MEYGSLTAAPTPPASTTPVAPTGTPLRPEAAVRLFYEQRYDALAAVLAEIPRPERPTMIKRMVERVIADKDANEGWVLARHIAHYPEYTPYFQSIPTVWNQGIFYVHAPFLRTRIHMSFFDHPKIRRTRIDYSFRILDQRGALVTEQLRTIHARETHRFELGDYLPATPPFQCGTFFIETVEPALGSLRIYAQWYNDHCMTTTHEKAAMANTCQFLVYPTIVCTPRHETFLAIANTGDEPLELNLLLRNAARQQYPQQVRLTFPARNAGLIPVSTHFTQVREFLAGTPGAIYLSTSHRQGIYYYFVHNTERQTWQIQHL